MQLGCGETISQCKLRQSCPPPRSWLYVPCSVILAQVLTLPCFGLTGELTWLDRNLSFGLGWFPAGSVAVSVSAVQPHELQHPRRGGGRRAQLWVGGNTPFDSCLLF